MFQYSAITSNGLAALSGSITDDNILKVTRIEYGDGIIEELKTATTASAILEIIRNQTSLVNKKCDLSVYKIEKKENSDVRTIVGVVDQLSVVEDFNAREAAIYAEYNGQEILFAYFTAVAFIDGEKTDTSNYISKVALSVKPCYFVTNISMANSTDVDYIFDADLSLPTITPIEIEGGYLLKIKDSLGEKNVEIKNRHLAGAGLKEEGDYLTAPVATQTTDGLMSSSDKSKLDDIENGANNYIHPTTAGNKHIPTGGATGQILGHSESGTAEWTGRHDFIYTCSTVATTSAKTVKLTGFKLETGACVRVCFSNGNSVASPTLNVNSTGAKEIRLLHGSEKLPISSEYGNLTSGGYIWEPWTILELMYDGTYWLIIRNSTDSQIPTGTIVSGLYVEAPTGYLLCDGSEVNISDYPKLYNKIGNLGICKSNTSGMFKLPDLRKRFLQGADENLGTFIEAGLPNITGVYSHDQLTEGGDQGILEIGALYNYGESTGSTGTSGSQSSNSHAIGFDASRSNPIYGNSETVQPPAICVNYIIKY